MNRVRIRGVFSLGLLLAFTITACHREEQAVVGVAQTAVKAEQKAQATASERDLERAQLEKIPLPTKSLYVDIHEPSSWANPFLSAGPETLKLRILQQDANPSPVGQGTMLRPEAARRQEMEIRTSELGKAIAAIPPGAWRYGRVIAITEAPTTNPKDRPKLRRTVEEAIKQLNDLGIVVEEWPAR
jgi:hypothetical protein